ncbi:hypothetical protein HY477_00105 [Candidatus Uhrbacteria bacterium]|nr:hypothetical protein [Candidatus Uhrbacteria bacterium]
MRLDTRKEELLSFIVREHSRTAQPVASDAVKEKAGLDLSPATIRNEMAALEKAGYLKQPHTSAGRVPTEAGYRYYIQNCMEEKNVTGDVGAFTQTVKGGEDNEARMKRLARELASEIREGVFVGFTPQSTFYTGLAYLFEQPEFESQDLVRHLSAIIDNLDRIVANLFEEVRPGVRVYVGAENPFGENCGTVLLCAGQDQPMMGVLGPMRMDYERTVAMMKALQQIL